MLMHNLSPSLALVVLATSLTFAQQSGSATKQADKVTTPDDLVGRYVISSGEKDGVKEPAERIEGIVVTFAKDKVIVTDKEKKEIYSASYTLDKSNPCQITMISKVEGSVGDIARGLIQRDKDDDTVVKLIYALPTGETPTEFKTKEKQLMFVMKKDAENEKPGQ
jgi:uncharacterized protein (TIGR03067 family)